MGADLSTVVLITPVIILTLFPHTLTPLLTLHSQIPTAFYMLKAA